MQTEPPRTVFEKLKFSDWHLPLFSLLCSYSLLHYYDLSCTPTKDQNTILAFLIINIIGFIVVFSSFFTDQLKPIFGFINTVLIVLYNIASAVMIIFIVIAVVGHFTEDREACHMDETVDLYFVWMACAILANFVYLCFKKMRRRQKFDEHEQLIIRGSQRGRV